MEYDKKYRDLERLANEATNNEHKAWEVREKVRTNLEAAKEELLSLQTKVIDAEHAFQEAANTAHRLRRELEALTVSN